METLWPLFGHLTFNTTLEEIMLKCPMTLELKSTPIEDTRTLDQPFTDAENFKSVDVVLPKNLFFLCLVYKHIDEFRREFRFQPDILDRVYHTIETAGGTNKTLVGIHVRRSDYGPYLIRVLNEGLVNATYFKNAMNYYRDNYREPLLFLIVSDDIKWCEENLLVEDDVKIVSADVAHDIALLSVCDHTIIDYGTYGVIGAYLSFGHKVMDEVIWPEKLSKIQLLPDTTQEKDVGMNCPDGPIVSVVYGGRLCNRIWETLNEIKQCNITLGPAMEMKEIEPLDTLAERFKGRHILLPAFTQIFEPMIPFSPAHDLALLTLCNHIIIDYGTYGFWAWFLSKGHSFFECGEEVERFMEGCGDELDHF
ncbi:Hypothetical predicted protein [Cloeon dipterum]|uniref:L-Fucosyltransferase n=1 Tax=Cloeon dipterum TaxID=197152 RepID=A0A8S1CGF2_9INSE|nr:Hypothetical predicted protein [Cloeon dipterum]